MNMFSKKQQLKESFKSTGRAPALFLRMYFLTVVILKFYVS